MSKVPIYIPIDDITTTKKNGIQVVDIREGSPVYERGSSESFVRTGRSSRRGVIVEQPSPTYTSDLLKETFASQESLRQAEQRYLAEQKAMNERIEKQTQSSLRKEIKPIPPALREIIDYRKKSPGEQFKDVVDKRIEEQKRIDSQNIKVDINKIDLGKETYREFKETYDFDSGMFLTPTGATSIMRPPTPEEKDKIYASDNIFFSPTADLKRKGAFQEKAVGELTRLSGELETLDLSLEEKDKSIREKERMIEEKFGKFKTDEGFLVETEEQFKELKGNIGSLKEDVGGYNVLASDYSSKVAQYNVWAGEQEQKVKVGLFGAQVERDIGEFDKYLKGDRSRSFYSTVGVLSETLGTTIGEGYRSAKDYFDTKSLRGGSFVLDSKDVIIKPEQKLTYPMFGGTMVWSQEQERLIPPTREVIIPKQRGVRRDIYSLTSDVIGVTGKVGEITGRTSPYLNPIGGKIYLGLQAERLAYSIDEQKDTKEGFKSWFKEAPIESTIALAIPVVKVAGVIKTAVTRPTITKTILVPEGSVKQLAFAKKVSVSGDKITYQDVTGISRTVKIGVKTEVSTPFREFFGMEPKYSGIPYGKIGSLERKGTIDFLVKKGFSRKQAEQLIALKKPELIENIFKGKAILNLDSSKEVGVKVIGIETQKRLPTLIDGVKTGGGVGKIKFISADVKNIGNFGKGIKLSQVDQIVKQSFLRGDVPFSKISQAGKTTSASTSVAFSRKIGERTLPVRKIEGGFISSKFDYFRQLDVSRRLMPLTKGIDMGRVRIYIEKPETTSALGKVFTGSGKKSSQDYLKQLYSKEQELASALGKVLDKEPVISTKILTSSERIIKPQDTTKLFISPSVIEEEVYSLNIQDTKTKTLPSISQKSKRESYLSNVNVGLSLSSSSVLQDTPIISLSDSGQRPKLDTTQQPRLDTTQQPILKIIQKPKLDTIKKTKLEGITPRLLRETNFRTPDIIKPFGIDIPNLGKGIKKAKRVVADKERFKVFVKKMGEDVEVDEFSSLGEAKETLTRKLRTTLRASGFIKKGEKKIKARELNLFGTEFIPSKKDKFTVVERKTRRLKSPQETREIIGFRGTKNSKNPFGL